MSWKRWFARLRAGRLAGESLWRHPSVAYGLQQLQRLVSRGDEEAVADGAVLARVRVEPDRREPAVRGRVPRESFLLHPVAVRALPQQGLGLGLVRVRVRVRESFLLHPVAVRALPQQGLGLELGLG